MTLNCVSHLRLQFSVLFSPRKLRPCCWLQIEILSGFSNLLQFFQRSPRTWMPARKERLEAKMLTFNQVCSSSNAFWCSFSFVPYRWGEQRFSQNFLYVCILEVWTQFINFFYLTWVEGELLANFLNIFNNELERRFNIFKLFKSQAGIIFKASNNSGFEW